MDHTYRKNFLRQVIFRADFDTITLGDFDGFKENQSSRFDSIQKQKGRVGNVTLDVVSGEVQNEATEHDVWSLENTSNKCKFEAAPTYCLLEYASYKNSDQLLQDIVDVMQPFLTKHNITEVRRIGLRYINEIQIPAIKKLSDWAKYVSKRLLVNTEFNGGYTKFVRTFSQLEIKLESFNLLLSFGVMNDKYPSLITNSPFILDIDCFTTIPSGLDRDNDIASYASRLNVEAEKMFEDSIEDKLRAEMDK